MHPARVGSYITLVIDMGDSAFGSFTGADCLCVAGRPRVREVRFGQASMKFKLLPAQEQRYMRNRARSRIQLGFRKGYKSYIKHGMSRTPEYNAYMRARHAPDFSFKSFEEFYAELGPRPTGMGSADRIDVSKLFAPGNARWIPRSFCSRRISPQPVPSGAIQAEWDLYLRSIGLGLTAGMGSLVYGWTENFDPYLK